MHPQDQQSLTKSSPISFLQKFRKSRNVSCKLLTSNIDKDLQRSTTESWEGDKLLSVILQSLELSSKAIKKFQYFMPTKEYSVCNSRFIAGEVYNLLSSMHTYRKFQRKMFFNSYTRNVGKLYEICICGGEEQVVYVSVTTRCFYKISLSFDEAGSRVIILTSNNLKHKFQFKENLCDYFIFQ